MDRQEPFFEVAEISEGNVLINADGGAGGIGSTLTPDVGSDKVLLPGESFTSEFRIGLATLNHFRFEVNVMGEPIH
jgi:hypothetical protein